MEKQGKDPPRHIDMIMPKKRGKEVISEGQAGI
jgi:hypothetical protein